MKEFKLNEDIPLEKSEQISVLSGRSLLCLKYNQIEKSIEASRRLLELDPDNFIGLRNLGSALKRKGEYEKSLEFYLKCVRIKPNDYLVWSNIAEIYDIKGDFVQSRIYALKAIELKPDMYKAYLYLGNAYMFEERVFDAIRCYKIALTSSTKSRIIQDKLKEAQLKKKELKRDVPKENVENWIDFKDIK